MTTIANLWNLHTVMTGGLTLAREGYLGLDRVKGQDQVDAANALLTDLDDLEALAVSTAELAQRLSDAASGPQAAQDRQDCSRVRRDAVAAKREARRLWDGVHEFHNI